MSILLRCWSVLLLLALAPVAHATLYVDPAYGGEAWSFENQNDVVAVTVYLHESNGTPGFRLAILNQDYIYDPVRNETRRELRGELQRTSQGGTVVTGLGPLFLEGRIEGGQLVYHAQGPGITRRLVPINYSYGPLAEQFRGLWVIAAFPIGFAPDSDYNESAGFIMKEMVPTEIGPGRRFENPVTQAQGLIVFNQARGIFQAQIVYAHLPTHVFLGVLGGNDKGLLGEGAYFDRTTGQQISPNLIGHAAPVFGTDKSGVLAARLLGLNTKTAAEDYHVDPQPLLDLLGDAQWWDIVQPELDKMVDEVGADSAL